MNGGFIPQLIEGSDKFFSLSYQQFEWLKKVQGTKCIVGRMENTDKYNRVFGTITSSTLPGDKDKSEFEYVVLINMSDMLKMYQRSVNQLQIYDNTDKLKLGDTIRFSFKNFEYQFKITDVQTFGITNFVLNQYTLSGFTEINNQ